MVTYAEIDAQLQGRNRESRKYANNTYWQRRGENIALKLHNTDIVTLYPTGDMTLNTGGWYTVTTKERINRVLPRVFYLHQEKGRWFVVNRLDDETYVFMDGMKITSEWKVEGSGIYEPKADKAVREKVRRYANLCTSEIPLEMPSGGDCWFCAFKTQDGKALGDTTDDEHLDQHMEEGYVVPSLVWNALEEAGYDPTKQIAHAVAFGAPNFDSYLNMGSDIVNRAVYKYILLRKGIVGR
tara:strand:+ start:246 stop:965 length:720 start_codon:yes stop_codon:yes gene_type:complete